MPSSTSPGSGLTYQRSSRKPLTIREYESEYRQHASDLELVERIFHGGMDSNQLRAALWPYVFGLVRERGRFVRKSSSPLNNNINNNGYYSSSGDRVHAPTSRSAGGGIGIGLGISPTNGYSSGDRYTRRPTMTPQRGEATKSPSSPPPPPPPPGNGSCGNSQYEYVEHEQNVKRWRELERLYATYESQWKSIMPDQELRFSVFRERKSLIERDVIRSDRTHPFYASDNCANLASLTSLLMTYMMYDFDIGYLQGMSDLAAPILYVYNGDLVKSFWVFVEVMKLFRRNFEHSQKTIHFQLKCLYRLLKLTDPKLASYLRQNDCSNCFFVFRCIVCQFKRELMKSKSGAGGCSGGSSSGSSTSGTSSSASTSSGSRTNCSIDHEQQQQHQQQKTGHEPVSDDNDDDQHSDLTSSTEVDDDDDDDDDDEVSSLHGCNNYSYAKVLNLWDTIWSVQRRHELLAQSKCVHTFTIANGGGRGGHKSQQKHNHHHHHYHHRHNHSNRNQQHNHRPHSSPINVCSTTTQEAPLHPTSNNILYSNNSNGHHHSTGSKSATITTNHDQQQAQQISRSYQKSNGSHQQQVTTTTTTTTPTATSNINSNKYNHKQQQQQNQQKLSAHNAVSAASTRHLANRQLNGGAHSNGRQSPIPSSHLNGSSTNGYSPTRQQQQRQQFLKRQSVSSMCSAGSIGSCCSLVAAAELSSSPSCTPRTCCAPVKQEQIVYTKETFYSSFDPNQTDVPRFELTETEKFVLSLCVSLIRRERNSILSRQMDASEIHQHFINPQLADNFDAFTAQAHEVYQYLNTDCDLQLLVKGANELSSGPATASSDLSPICGIDGHTTTVAGPHAGAGITNQGAAGGVTSTIGSADTTDTYDLLKDYLIISPTSYNISMSSLNNLHQSNSLSIGSCSDRSSSGGGGRRRRHAAATIANDNNNAICRSCTSNSIHHYQHHSHGGSGAVSFKKRTPSYAGLPGSKCSVSQKSSWDYALNSETTFNI